MINWKLIYKVLGQLLFIEASLLLLSLLVAVYYQQEDIFAFIVATLTTIGGGLILKWRGHGADNSMSRRDAYLVVSLSWIIFSLFGTLPFMVSGYINHFTDAYFETMSGFTTTGATILDDVECFPHGLLFWRSLTQWIGGLGIVFFTIACILSYYVAGMGLFDSFNYAMTTTATGGFSTHNTSTEFFHSPSLEYVCTFFCFLSGVNFTLLYAAVIKFKIKELFRNSEFRFYIFLVTVFSIFIMVELIVMRNYDIEHAFRSAIFQVVSFITTTGLFNDDAALWPHVTWVVLSMCMFIGACSGSTSGGLKCIRGVILLRMVKNEFRQILHPNAVLPLKIDGVNVPMQKRVTLLAFLTIYLIICVIISFTMIAMGIDNTNAITITLSCVGNVGPTLGTEIGPTMSWSELPDLAKWFCSLMMLIGRLEIFTVLVIFTPAFWKEN